MSTSERSRTAIAAELLNQAARRFGEDRAALLRPYVEMTADSIARVLAVELDPADESPASPPVLEGNA